MKEQCLRIVQRAVARHLAKKESEITPEQDLALDLELDPLDLVLVAMRLEDEVESLEFPVESLARVRKVRDLVELVRDWRREAPLEASP